MQYSTVLIAVLAAAASAAPTAPKVVIHDARSAVDALSTLSDYFNTIAGKAIAAKLADSSAVCDLSKASMPAAPELLPVPSEGLHLRHVAVGRGVQKYECADDSSAPTAAGAVATLFNASCVAALYPDLLETIPGMAVHFDLSSAQQLGPTGLLESGHHYFTNATTPFFDVQSTGEAPCQKNATSPTPSGAAVGQQGEAAVPWLKLTTRDGATGGIKEVYRLTTAGGSAPSSCEGMSESFEVEYAALYWFWAE
ncbi:hypothetical protein EDB81DRAFT_438936 [Dactylonectria macrodidyma]|uniref:Malate dehydrogenase n=1 Tax=Dactylonectria macrodidyma TaxID=307937 RepID=A0A9P9F524_9HYPO|nr:hypothetical protein EDB81DRAFT_438936 [Dactylonectria macrodidyma]